MEGIEVSRLLSHFIFFYSNYTIFFLFKLSIDLFFIIQIIYRPFFLLYKLYFPSPHPRWFMVMVFIRGNFSFRNISFVCYQIKVMVSLFSLPKARVHDSLFLACFLHTAYCGAAWLTNFANRIFHGNEGQHHFYVGW